MSLLQLSEINAQVELVRETDRMSHNSRLKEDSRRLNSKSNSNARPKEIASSNAVHNTITIGMLTKITKLTVSAMASAARICSDSKIAAAVNMLFRTQIGTLKEES